MTQEELEAWRAHPVTEWVLECLRAQCTRDRDGMTAAYWAGKAVPEEQRLALLREEALIADLSEASAADFTEAMEKMSATRAG